MEIMIIYIQNHIQNGDEKMNSKKKNMNSNKNTILPKYFVGERRLIHEYMLLKLHDPSNPILSYGQVDGNHFHFRKTFFLREGSSYAEPPLPRDVLRMLALLNLANKPYKEPLRAIQDVEAQNREYGIGQGEF